MASVREVSPSHWEVRVSLGNGRRLSRTVVGTRADADALALRLEMQRGRLSSADGVTLDAYFEGCYLPARSDLSPETVENYRHLWKRVSSEFGSMPLSEPPHAQVQAWILSMTRGSATHCAKLLRSVLRDAWYCGLLEREPMKQPLRYPRADTSIEVWDAHEAVEALKLLRGHRIYPLVLLMVGAGLRRSEALAASWDDVEFGDTVTVRVDKSFHHGTMRPTKNQSSVRTVPIAEPFASMLREIRSDGRICPMTEDAARSSWRRLREGELAGMSIPMKNLRHTHESLMRDAGVSDSVNSQIHGHSDIKTDYRHYLARTSQSSRDAARRLGAYMEEHGGAVRKQATGIKPVTCGLSGRVDWIRTSDPLTPSQAKGTEPQVGASRGKGTPEGWRFV